MSMRALARSVLGRLQRPFGSSSSEGFVEVSRDELSLALSDAWKDDKIPGRQFEECTKKELERYRSGEPVLPYDVLIDILRDNIEGLDGKKLLEIGCSSGYYSEVLKIKGINTVYHGCDYSEVFIQFARKLFPGVDFRVEDACALSYPDGSFDIVVSGGCLLHIMDYPKAIAEAARVTTRNVVFHRTPVLHRKETSYYLKSAYGVRMFEIHFNEREFFRLLRRNGLKVVDIITFSMSPVRRKDDFFAYKTYLCSRG